MDLFQLEVFVAVAREGSFSRAAEKLFRTQPAVSQHLAKLRAAGVAAIFGPGTNIPEAAREVLTLLRR